MHNEGLLNINKLEIHRDSYFEMSTLYYFQLLILKDERNMGTKLPLMTKKDNFMYNAGLLIISKPEIHQDSYFEMSTLYYFQLPILKYERNMGTKIPLMTKKDNFLYNEGLLIIIKPKIHQDSYFEMSTLYYFQLLILKDERNMGTKLPLMTKKDNFMYNAGLLIISKPEIHQDSYFEMSTLYYFQLLILKDERNMGTKLPLMTKKDNFMYNAGLLIISKPEIHQDSYFEMSTLYYFQLPILKYERNMGTKIPLMTKKDNFLYNEGLLIIIKPKIHQDSYFEMSTLYYFQLLILKDERNMGTKLPLMTKKDNFMYNAGLLIISKPEIHQDSYFEMYTLYYFQLLILKDERNMGTKLPLMTKNDNFMHNAGL